MLVFLPSLRTQAESQDGFMLDGTGAVTLQSQHAAKEEVSSLQFSLTVETEGEAQVEFVFEPNHARIAEFRYDEAAKKLNIYMAGVDPLFEENTDTLAVGKVVVRNGSGGEAVAKVSVVEDSLQYVYVWLKTPCSKMTSANASRRCRRSMQKSCVPRGVSENTGP